MSEALGEPRIVAFDPHEIQQSRVKIFSKACEACHLRKVRCPLGSNGDPCDNCLKYGVACRPRIRRRKVDARAEARQRTAGSTIVAAATETTTSPPPPRATTTAPGLASRINSPANTLWDTRLSPLPTGTAAPASEANVNDSQTSDAGLTNHTFFVDRRSHSLRRSRAPASPSRDQFKGSAFVSRFAILGDSFPGLDNAHDDDPTSSLADEAACNISPLDLQMLQLYGAFELPDLALRQSLIDAFFDWCWAWCPVLEYIETESEPQSSLTMLQAVLLAGSIMRPNVCSSELVATLYRRVKALVHTRHEDDPLTHVAAIVIIQWYTPTTLSDISADLPRFWMTHALALAHQIGLHHEPNKDDRNYGLRRRIWWAIYTCDCLSAAAEGRPRLINLEDCSVSPPTVNDFPRESESTAIVFVAFVGIVGILSDVCQVLTRRREISRPDRARLENSLETYARDFPQHLRLYDDSNQGLYRPFNLQTAQLHIHFLTTIIILYRPKSLCFPSEEDAPSLVAAEMCLEIFHAIHLREMIPRLATIFSWHLMVVAVAQISFSRITGLREQCNEALDSIENILHDFASIRPAAANNLRNVRAIRKAVMNRNIVVPTQMPTPVSQSHEVEPPPSCDIQVLVGPVVLQWYGPRIKFHLERIVQTHRRHSTMQRGTVQNHGIGDDGEIVQHSGNALHDEIQQDGNIMVGGIEDAAYEELRNNLWMRDLVEELEMVYDVVM